MALDHLKGFIFILILLWIAWFLAGGPSKPDKDKPYIHPAQPIGTGDTYGPTKK